jgi:hypothetical protein
MYLEEQMGGIGEILLEHWLLLRKLRGVTLVLLVFLVVITIILWLLIDL